MSSTRDPAKLSDPAVGDPAPSSPDDHREEMPRVVLTRRRLVAVVLFAGTVAAFLYFVLPQLSDLDDTWNRIQGGDHLWLGAALVLQLGAYVSYNTLFRTVMVREHGRINWRESFQITLAALAATRLFNAAGAGGMALQAWALRRSGMEARVVACRIIAFNVLLYVIYMLVLIVGGLGLYLGVLSGGGSFAITVLPAVFGATAIAVFLAFTFLPSDLERRFAKAAGGTGRRARWARRLATAPAAIAQGTRTAIALLREGRPGLLGAAGWWAFDAGVLWACFHAFGEAPPIGVIAVGYFVGMLANLIPLPGGVGGVEGGMIGAFAALGVEPKLALVSVLAYRGFSFWLPTVPGIIAYLTLRRTAHRWDSDPTGAAPI